MAEMPLSPTWFSPRTPLSTLSLQSPEIRGPSTKTSSTTGHSPRPHTPDGLSPRPPQATELRNLEEGRQSPTEHTDSDDNPSPTMLQKVTAEIVGTYFLIFIGCGSVLIDQRYNISFMSIAVCWGLVVMVVIYSLAHVSGAHFNPAVTIAFATFRRIPWKQAFLYIAAQVLGATLASLMLHALFGRDDLKPTLTVPGKDKLNAFVWEFIISFILMFVINSIGTDKRAITEFTGVAVGFTVLFNVLLAGHVTGASMNPARSIGPALIAQRYEGIWIYLTAPVLGMIIATVLHNFLRLPDKMDKESSKTVK